jgi:hypothetical protein
VGPARQQVLGLRRSRRPVVGGGRRLKELSGNDTKNSSPRSSRRMHFQWANPHRVVIKCCRADGRRCQGGPIGPLLPRHHVSGRDKVLAEADRVELAGAAKNAAALAAAAAIVGRLAG